MRTLLIACLLAFTAGCALSASGPASATDSGSNHLLKKDGADGFDGLIAVPFASIAVRRVEYSTTLRDTSAVAQRRSVIHPPARAPPRPTI